MNSFNPTEEEQNLISKLLSLALEITSEKQYLDDHNFLRVLRARELNLEAAFEMWKKWYEWRVQYRADEITEEEMMPHIRTGAAFFHGVDNKNRPILIVRLRFNRPRDFSIESHMRYLIYMVEKGVKLADEVGSGQICVINDRSEMTDDNRDPKMKELMRSLSGMLQDFYAERLGALYILHVNWFFWLMFQFAKPFINRKTKEKIHVLKNVEGLREFIENGQLLVEYGGSNEYVHPYPHN